MNQEREPGFAVSPLFPGQGSQAVRMGRAMAAAYPESAACFDEASDVLGIPMRRLCWDSGPEELRATENAQPALVTASVAIWRGLEAEGLTPSAVAGHSVGTLSACVAAGSLTFAGAVALARQRGLLMASAPGDGAMCAVTAGGGERVALMARSVRMGLNVAADNSPRQFVVSGDRHRVEEFTDLAGRRAKAVNVSHAFHSRLMEPVRERWSEAVAAVTVHAPRVPVGLPSRGRPSCEASEIRADLVRGLCEPVRWREVTGALLDRPEPVVAIGPGRVLVGLARQMPGTPQLPVVDSPASLAALTRRLAGSPGNRPALSRDTRAVES